MALINSTEAAIIAALVQGEKYGLAIIEHVKTASDGKLKLTLGGIYPTLYRMQEKGLVKSRWGAEHEVKGGARRRYYGATALGRTNLSDVAQAISTQPSWADVARAELNRLQSGIPDEFSHAARKNGQKGGWPKGKKRAVKRG